MRPFLLLSLLLLSLLIFEAQGIRFEKGFASVEHLLLHENTIHRTSNGGTVHAILCKDAHCSGDSRKLLTKTTSSAINTSKNEKNGGSRADPISPHKLSSEQHGEKEESFFNKSSPVTGDREGSTEHYPDILDLAGMDYSPARRKPPIHN